MSLKSVLAALAAALVAGCATTAPHGTDGSTARTAGGLLVRGELIDLTDVKIYVNGQKVIDEQLALLSGDGNFSGKYQGKAVSAECSSSSGMGLAKTRCAVTVGGERLPALVF